MMLWCVGLWQAADDTRDPGKCILYFLFQFRRRIFYYQVSYMFKRIRFVCFRYKQCALEVSRWLKGVSPPGFLNILVLLQIFLAQETEATLFFFSQLIRNQKEMFSLTVCLLLCLQTERPEHHTCRQGPNNTIVRVWG